MTKLKIKVTKDILERSKKCLSNCSITPTNCAIALAVRDIFPDAYVDLYVMYFDKKDVGDYLAPPAILPINAVSFIQEFDSKSPSARVKMPEIEFEISIPDEVIEKINIDELRPLLQNHPTLELV